MQSRRERVNKFARGQSGANRGEKLLAILKRRSSLAAVNPTPPDSLVRRVLLVAAAAMAATGGTVIAGWMTSARALVTLGPGVGPMVFNTALGFILVGGALFALAAGRSGWVRVGGVAAAILGGATLLEYLTGRSLGLDEFFWRQQIDVQGSEPGRMVVPWPVTPIRSSCRLRPNGPQIEL